eukprot:4401092-Amphidinium_carterae.1
METASNAGPMAGRGQEALVFTWLMQPAVGKVPFCRKKRVCLHFATILAFILLMGRKSCA